MAQTYLEATQLTLSFGDKCVLDLPYFALRAGERVGLVGENGAGKTTLLRVLAGEILPDTGNVRRLRRLTWIRQMGEEDRDANGEMRGVFRVEETHEGLSGGEKTRRRIAAALSSGAPILLADEPTTDLDAEGIALLRKQLLRFDGAVLLVSHDRSLLDEVCTSVMELRDGHGELFPGNYSVYAAERERRMEFKRFEYQQYRAEQARLRMAIQGKREQQSQILKTPARMGNSEARLHKRGATEIEEKVAKERKALQSRLAHLEEKERVREDPSIRMKLGSASPVGSKTILEIRGLTMHAGGKLLLENASMRVPTGSTTVLMGENGCGKTTLVRRITQGNDPRIRLAPGAKIGIFIQDHAEALDMERTALENAVRHSVHDQSDCRRVLARLGIGEGEALKPAGLLSGGEQAKVALARLLLSDVNFLLLDEPTNHLDIFTMEALESLLAEYGGTILLISHDKRFVNAVASRLVRFEHRTLTSFEGNLQAWQEKVSASKQEKEAVVNQTILQMRMAELATRISAPKKGDDPLKLNEEYFSLAQQLRERKE